MKTSLLFCLAVACSLIGCSKKTNPTPVSNLVTLPNTTWRGYVTTVQNDSLFQFVQFLGSTQASVTVGNSLTDPNKSTGTYPCQIKIDPTNSNSDIFLVTYSTKVDTGFTLSNKVLVYHGNAMTQYN